MHEWVFIAATLDLLLLVAVLGGYGLRTESLIHRVLALDTLSLVLVALFCVVGYRMRLASILDLALVVAMLGFIQTVVTCRILGREGGSHD